MPNKKITYVKKKKNILAVMFILTHIFLFSTKWKRKYTLPSEVQFKFQWHFLLQGQMPEK